MKFMHRVVAEFLLLSLLFWTGMPGRTLAAPDPMPFEDVQGTGYETVVATLRHLGVVAGVDETRFNPTGLVTRAQMASLIVRAMGKTQEADLLKSVDAGYTDVSARHWARGFVALASRAGIVKGDGGLFHPDDPVNYAQAVTMLVRAAGYEDQVYGGYPAGYVVKGNELGLLKDVHIELYGAVNRAEAAHLLYNAIFRVPAAATKLTWSQSVFKEAATLSFEKLPQYAAPGQQITLAATARDLMDNPLPDAAIQYAVTAGAGQVLGNTLTMGEGGPVTVQASLGTLVATASLTPVTGLVISPETSQANKGGTLQLSATALAGAQRVAVEPTWQVITGPAAVNAQGLVTVNDYGSVVIQATLGSLVAVSTGQAVGKVSITQKPAYLVPGLTYTFSATAADSTGGPIPVPIAWSATGATIDQVSGRLTNPTGTRVMVTATAGGISETTAIAVLQSIAITPASTTLLRGGQITFTAKGVDSAGNQYDIQPDWERTVSSVGVINTAGAFAGTGSGTTGITATLGSLRGQAQVLVSGPPARMNVATTNATLPGNGKATTTITVKLLDDTGAASPVDDQPITFVLGGVGSSTISRAVALTKQGEATITFTAGTGAATNTVTAAAPGTSIPGQTAVITTYQQTPALIQLTATPQPLATGGGLATVMATLVDSNGFSVSAAQALYVTLASSGTAYGSLTGTSITIPAGQSSGSLSFISTSLPGSVQVSGSSPYPVTPLVLQTANAGAAAGIKIRPIRDPTPVTGLSSLQVQVDVVDAAGVIRANDNTTQVALSVTGPGSSTGTLTPYTTTAVGGTATFQILASAVGTATLTASLTGSPVATDTVTAEFVPGVLSTLRLTVQPAMLAADGVSQTQVIAEVVDRSGIIITNVNPVITFRRLVDAGATVALTDLAVQAAGGIATLTLRSTRFTGTDIWYATAPGLETQNLATIATSATSGDAYTLRAAGTTAYALGSPSTLNIQVVDQQERVVTTDSGRTITATHSIPGATVSTAAVTQNGQATFVISGGQATSGIITFSSPGLQVPTLQTTVSFATMGSAARLLSLASSYTVRNVTTSTVSISVRVLDNEGNTLTTESGRSISVTMSPALSGVTVSPSPNQTTAGVATFTLSVSAGASAGTVALTFTAPGLPQPQETLTITITN